MLIFKGLKFTIVGDLHDGYYEIIKIKNKRASFDWVTKQGNRYRQNSYDLNLLQKFFITKEWKTLTFHKIQESFNNWLKEE